MLILPILTTSLIRYSLLKGWENAGGGGRGITIRGLFGSPDVTPLCFLCSWGWPLEGCGYPPPLALTPRFLSRLHVRPPERFRFLLHTSTIYYIADGNTNTGQTHDASRTIANASGVGPVFRPNTRPALPAIVFLTSLSSHQPVQLSPKTLGAAQNDSAGYTQMPRAGPYMSCDNSKFKSKGPFD